jgi:hypothetical protein
VAIKATNTDNRKVRKDTCCTCIGCACSGPAFRDRHRGHSRPADKRPATVTSGSFDRVYVPPGLLSRKTWRYPGVDIGLIMQAFGLSWFLRSTKARHDGCWETPSGSTPGRCEHEEQAQVQRGVCQTSGWCVRAARLKRHRYEGRSGDHADANSAHEDNVFVDVEWGWHLRM